LPYYTSPSITIKNTTQRSSTTLSKTHKRSNTLIPTDHCFREIKQKFVTNLQNLPTKNTSISFIVSENPLGSQHKSISDILNYRSTRPAIADSEIRMISFVDSKPVSPYISLLPLQDFLKKEQEISRKGAIGKSNIDSIKGNYLALFLS